MAGLAGDTRDRWEHVPPFAVEALRCQVDAIVAKAMRAVWASKQTQLCEVVGVHVAQLAPVQALLDDGDGSALTTEAALDGAGDGADDDGTNLGHPCPTLENASAHQARLSSPSSCTQLDGDELWGVEVPAGGTGWPELIEETTYVAESGVEEATTTARGGSAGENMRRRPKRVYRMGMELVKVALAHRTTLRALPPTYQRAVLEPLLNALHRLHDGLRLALTAVPEALAPSHAYLTASTAAHARHALRAMEEALRGDDEAAAGSAETGSNGGGAATVSAVLSAPGDSVRVTGTWRATTMGVVGSEATAAHLLAVVRAAADDFDDLTNSAEEYVVDMHLQQLQQVRTKSLKAHSIAATCRPFERNAVWCRRV